MSIPINNPYHLMSTLFPVESTTEDKVLECLQKLSNPSEREATMLCLSQYITKENIPDLGLYIWHSPGTVAILLQELIRSYDVLFPHNEPALRQNHQRLSSTLALFQAIAEHPVSRLCFLESEMFHYFVPVGAGFKTSSPVFDEIREYCLRIIAAILQVKESQPNPANCIYLLSRSMNRILLNSVKHGGVHIQLLAAFIINFLTSQEETLDFLCTSPQRFREISILISLLLVESAQQEVIFAPISSACLYITKHRGACHSFMQITPEALKDQSFVELLKQTERGCTWLRMLSRNINTHQRH